MVDDALMRGVVYCIGRFHASFNHEFLPTSSRVGLARCIEINFRANRRQGRVETAGSTK